MKYKFVSSVLVGVMPLVGCGAYPAGVTCNKEDLLRKVGKLSAEYKLAKDAEFMKEYVIAIKQPEKVEWLNQLRYESAECLVWEAKYGNEGSIRELVVELEIFNSWIPNPDDPERLFDSKVDQMNNSIAIIERAASQYLEGSIGR